MGAIVRACGDSERGMRMRFRLGVVLGFAVGYYLGAKAGRTRYLQLREWIEKARPVVDLGMERARDLVERNDDPVLVDLGVNGGNYSPSR
jgi:hypothetical protein